MPSPSGIPHVQESIAPSEAAEKLTNAWITVEERPPSGPRKPREISAGFSPCGRCFFGRLRFSAASSGAAARNASFSAAALGSHQFLDVDRHLGQILDSRTVLAQRVLHHAEIEAGDH